MVQIPAFVTSGFTTFTTTLSATKKLCITYSQNCWFSSTVLPTITEAGKAFTKPYPSSLKFSTNGDIGLAFGYGIPLVVAIALGARKYENYNKPGGGGA